MLPGFSFDHRSRSAKGIYFRGRGFGNRLETGRIRGYNCLSCFAYMDSETEFLNHLKDESTSHEHNRAPCAGSIGHKYGRIQCADCLQIGGTELYKEHQYGSTFYVKSMLIRIRCPIYNSAPTIHSPHYCPCGAVFGSEYELKLHEQSPQSHPVYFGLEAPQECQLICK